VSNSGEKASRGWCLIMEFPVLRRYKMFGYVKCGSCGKQFRPQRSIRVDICPECAMARNYSRWLSEPQNTTGDSELDEAERKVRNAKFENANERVSQISGMEHKVAKWQQLNRILNASDEILPNSERSKFECMRRDLEGSKEVQAFLREAKARDLRERRRGAGS
jgi:predicted RNA-binding Zn-ribbon protein involved in translation (DUF1610 family)